MRHVGSLLLAAIFAPAIFLLTGTGLSAFGSARSGTFADDPLSTLAALGALLLAGVLYGILVMVRLSPLGPGLAGVALMSVSGWALTSPDSYDETFSMVDVHMGGAVGQWGLGILLGVPLLATVTSQRRWRRDGDVYGDNGGPSIPDSTRNMPAYMTLPDIPAPSLRYPAPSEMRPPQEVPHPPRERPGGSAAERQTPPSPPVARPPEAVAPPVDPFVPLVVHDEAPLPQRKPAQDPAED